MSWAELVLDPSDSEDRVFGYRLTPADPPRRIVLALHGAGNDALFGWVGLFKRLLTSGSEIITIDLPGHGRDGISQFSPESSHDAIRSLLLQIPSDGAIPVHALGVSLGGSVLIPSLAVFGDRFTSAALVVAPLQIDFSWRSVTRELGLQTMSTLWTGHEHYGLTGLIPSFGPFKRATYPLRLPINPPGPFGYVDFLNQCLREMRLIENARAVSLPTLLIYGARDLVVPIEQGEALASAIPISTFVRIANGTHLSTPLHPAAMERIVEFFGEES